MKNAKNLTVSKISFICGLDDYYGIVVSENKNIICAANISGDLEVRGFSIVVKNKIKEISSNGKRCLFFEKVLNARSAVVEGKLLIGPKTTLADALGARKGIIGVDFICPSDEFGLAYSFGYVEEIDETSFKIRFVGMEGRIDWGSLDEVKYSDAVKLEWDTGYIQAFELVHKKSKSSLLRKWKSARRLDLKEAK